MTEYKVLVPWPTRGKAFAGVGRVINSVTSNIGDFRFDILTPEPDERQVGRFPGNVEFRTFKKRFPGYGMDYRRPSVKKIFDEDRYDLIWNNPMMLNSISTAAETPCVSTFHSIQSGPPHGFPGSISDLKRRIEWKLKMKGFRSFSDADRVVCISDATRNIIERRVSADSVRIYNGADALGLENSEKDEGYIFSADSPEAAVYVADRIGFPAKVIDASQKVKRFAENSSADIEVITDFISDEELKELYRNCSFHISGAHNDGFGITPLEANAFGKPTLTFTYEATAETVRNGKTGYACPNLKDMIEKAEKLVGDPELRQEMGEEAVDHVRENFRWEDVAEQYREEFISVIAMN